MHCLCLWHLVLHLESAEEALGKIPAWLPLQTQDISPQVLEENSRLCNTKTNDKVDWRLIRSLSITTSINVSPLCLINLRLSAFSVLLPNTELNISFRVLQTVQSSASAQPFLCWNSYYLHHFIVTKSFFTFSCIQHPLPTSVGATSIFWCWLHTLSQFTKCGNILPIFFIYVRVFIKSALSKLTCDSYRLISARILMQHDLMLKFPLFLRKTLVWLPRLQKCESPSRRCLQVQTLFIMLQTA